ncbi:FtsX-like permease family protein [Bacillus sp. FSL W7-1360]
MSWTIKYAIKSIRQNLLRTFLIALGAALGVMLVTMLLLGNDAVEETTHQQVTSRYGDYDLQFGYHKNNQYLNDQQLHQIEGLDVAGDVSKVLIPYPQANQPELDGKPSYWGVEPDSPDMASFEISSGRYPKSGAEMAITESYADKENIAIDDSIRMPFPPFGEKNVKVVGILQPPASAAMGHSAYFPLEWLQNELNLQDQFNLVQVKLFDSSTKGLIAHNIHQSMEEVKIDQRSYMDKEFGRLNAMKPLIFSLGGIALLVVGLLIMGSFFLSVRARYKQWAVLRALGTRSRQIMSVVLVEAFLVGVIGSLLGVVLGMVTHQVSIHFISDWMNVESTNQGMYTISWKLVPLIFLLGVSMSILGSIIPAFIIRKIPPVQALRTGVSVNQRKEKTGRIVGMFLTVFGLIMGMGGSQIEKVANFNPGMIGATLFALGLLFVIPSMICWIVPIMDRLFRLLFPTESFVSSRNVIRYRYKASVSVAILVFGFILAVAGNIYMNSMDEGIKTGLQKSLPSDLVMRVPTESREIDSLPFQWLEKIKMIDGVQESLAVTSDYDSKLVNYDFTKADQEWLRYTENLGGSPEQFEVVGTDLSIFGEIFNIEVVTGSPLSASLKDGKGVITKEVSDSLGLKVNDTVVIQSKNKPAMPVKVVSIVNQDMLLKNNYILVDETWAKKHFAMKGYESIQLNTDSEASFDKIEKQVKSITKGNDNVEVINSHDLLKEQQQLISQMLGLIYILVGIVVIISGIGLVNAIVASLHERRAEITMIRALGASPGQMMKIIWLEGAFLGFIAGVIGSIGGLLFSYMVIPNLDLTIQYIPYMQLLFLVFVGAGLGTIASCVASVQLRHFQVSDTLKELS